MRLRCILGDRGHAGRIDCVQAATIVQVLIAKTGMQSIVIHYSLTAAGVLNVSLYICRYI